MPMLVVVVQFIRWLSNLRKKHGKVFRVFTGSRPYVVLMDKVVSKHGAARRRDALQLATW